MLMKIWFQIAYLIGAITLVSLLYGIFLVMLEWIIDKSKMFSCFRKELLDYRKNKEQYKLWKERY